jgi:hypothetical protein
MPWTHCSREILDTESCPVCGIDKESWTVLWDNTRVFQIKTKRKSALKLRLWSNDLEELVADEPFTLFDVEGKVLHQGTLDEEGYAKLASKELGGVCLVAFPSRKPGEVGPHPEHDPQQPSPDRWLCHTDKLYEFVLQLFADEVVIELEDVPPEYAQVSLEVEEALPEYAQVSLEVEETLPDYAHVMLEIEETLPEFD